MTRARRGPRAPGAAGAAASFGLARLIASLLYAIAPNDPATFLGSMLFMALVALMAGYLPAWRASRIDPSAALRSH